MAGRAESRQFVHLSRPNRSLSPAAQLWVLGAMSSMALVVGVVAMAFGAWPVMPFAGLEVALLALAFRVLREHDADFERLEIGDHEVSVEARDARKLTRFVANRAWVRVVVRERGERCTLRLAYAGRTEPLGRMLSDEGRRQLAKSLRGRLPVTAK